jgi:transcriptional regulator with XRE-family HTH domain
MTASTGEEGRLDPAPNRKGAIPADSFANRLMLSRAHAGNIAIREAALKCGLNYGSWSNWERGGMPRDLLETVRKISDGLGIDDEWLLFGGALVGRSWRDRAQKNGGGNMTQ